MQLLFAGFGFISSYTDFELNMIIFLETRRALLRRSYIQAKRLSSKSKSVSFLPPPANVCFIGSVVVIFLICFFNIFSFSYFFHINFKSGCSRAIRILISISYNILFKLNRIPLPFFTFLRCFCRHLIKTGLFWFVLRYFTVQYLT